MPQYLLKNYAYNVSVEDYSELNLSIAVLANNSESPADPEFINRLRIFLSAISNKDKYDMPDEAIKEIATTPPEVIKKDVINSAFDRLEV